MDLFETLRRYAVIPVITIDSVDAAVPLADALIRGGLPVVEITFRTAAAADAIALIRKERPEMIVGAGTLISLENVDQAKACGTHFGVAPGLNPDIVTHAAALDLPFIPGVATPTDVEAAISLGITNLKFFPAEASGGMAMLKSLYGPYAHTGIQFMPTGGVTMKNVTTYLSHPAVMMVGGTWLAKKDAIAAGNWDEIEQTCQRTCDKLKTLE